MRAIDDATMAGPRLRATLEKDLQALAPLVDYLCAALDLGSDMKKWLAALAVVLVLLLGYGVAGPTSRSAASIPRSRRATRTSWNATSISRRCARTSAPKVAKRLLASATAPSGRVVGDDLGRVLIGKISDKAVDAMVSPMGIALLLEGRALSHRVTGDAPVGEKDDAADPAAAREDRFESPSRFTATVDSADGARWCSCSNATGWPGS